MTRCTAACVQFDVRRACDAGTTLCHDRRVALPLRAAGE
jgi:hypothetical protein